MSSMLKGFVDHERKVLTFDLYDCLLNFRLINHFVGQVGRENNIVPDLVESYFRTYMSQVKNGESYLTYHDLLYKVMDYLDMEFATKVFSANAEELYLIHKDLEPHADVLPALEQFKNNGFELYLLADANLQLVQSKFDIFDGFFNEVNVLCADEMRCYKPKADFFRFADEKFKLRSADDHFHVSSNYFTDIEPAIKRHWLTAYINRGKTGVLVNCEPNVVLPTLTELEEAMVNAHKKIEDEERAAQEREQQAKEAVEKQERARAEAARLREQQTRMQQLQQQQRQQQQQLKLRGSNKYVNSDFDGGAGINPYFVPQNERDWELTEKMRHMAPTKARALAKARERALANAKLRNG